MLTRSKLLFAALAAAAMMLTLVANASAGHLKVTEKNFELLWERARPLTFEAAGNPIRCPITLLGRFNENTIEKRLNSNIGTINHVERPSAGEPPCTGGTYSVLQESLPWRVSYQGFTGELPRIRAIRLLLIGVAFSVTPRGLEACLAGTTTRNPAAGEVRVNENNGMAEELIADETLTIPLGGGFLCRLAGNSSFRGTATILNLPGLARITVTLI